MRLIKPAILVLALTVLVNSIGSLLLGWQLNSLTSSLCMLLLGLILLQAQNSGPGERSLPPSGVRLLGAVGVILSGIIVARDLYRSDVDVLPAPPVLGLLGYVLVRSLRDRQTHEVTSHTISARQGPSPACVDPIQNLGNTPSGCHPEKTVIHRVIVCASRNVACGPSGPAFVLGDRHQARHELRSLQQSGKSDSHHAGNVIDLSSVVKLFSSVRDDDVDPVTNQRKLGIKILAVMEPCPILPGT